MKVEAHIQAIKKKVLDNFKVTESELKEWETLPYYMDSTYVAKFWDKVEKAPAVRIVGDYDVDGIMASYIMSKSIMHVFKSKPVKIRLPRRFSEGYGINPNIVDEIMEKDAKGTLIITVDNGIACPDLFEKLQNNGYPVIITDHHQLGSNRLANVEMVLDPKLPNQKDVFCGDYWCGAAVAYKLAEQYLDEEMSAHMEVFAGIATIADVMDLKEGNWGLVKRTLKAFRDEKAPAQLFCLLTMLQQDPKFANEETFSYYLCPALNAPGRLDDAGASKVLSYLISPTVEKAKYLIDLNETRKKLRKEQTEMVINAIMEQGLENSCPIWVALSNLHEGIIGIIASDITKTFNVPAIILTEKEDGTLKGSSRTYGDVDIFNYLLHCGAEFIKMGGHTEAAGMSMTKEEFEKGRLCQIPKPVVDSHLADSIYINQQEIPELCDELKEFEPFGKGNPKPLFSTLIDVDADNAKFVGEDSNHLILNGNSEDGPYKITHFHHIPNELKNQDRFILYGTLIDSVYNGEKVPSLDGEVVVDCDEVEHENDYEK